MSSSILAENSSEVNIDLIRAQYDSRAAAAGPKSSSYRFDTPLGIDGDGAYCHRLIITRLSDEAEIVNTPYYSTDDLNDAIANWKVQLNIRSMGVAMWGKTS